jgi:hypothetical protein
MRRPGIFSPFVVEGNGFVTEQPGIGKAVWTSFFKEPD